MTIGRPKSQRTLDGLHKCFLCKEIKALNEFHRDKGQPDGYGYRCKICNKSYKKGYHEKYYAENREEIKKRRRAQYQQHREKRLSDCRELRKRNGKKWGESRRARNAANPVPNMLSLAKKRAKERELEFSLIETDIIIPKYCPALGVKMEVSKGRSFKNSPTLDRIDNRYGYTKENVVVISHRANTIKNDATIEELRKILEFYESLK